MKQAIQPGQRWISEAEPELGLGTVLKFESGQITIFFPATGASRIYSAENSPLKRVQFRAGDKIKSHDGQTVTVDSVDTRDGLFVYHGDGYEIPETDLSDTISFDKPQDRLFGGHVDDPWVFDLRARSLALLHEMRKSPYRGFVGGRIDLIPHQLFVANEVSSRPLPRVLLADEVGLGKTIEACLILHRLLVTRRISRVLILVPEPLVHQWFVELMRKFNLTFSIFDEDRCSAIEGGDPGCNPFMDEQLVLTHVPFLVSHEKRAAQICSAEWDLVIVDEAHHLQWSPDEPSREYAVIDELGRRSPGLLLLTATPEQLGQESHFARLRLLDPDRYHDLEAYIAESKGFGAVAKLAGKLVDGKALTSTETKKLGDILREDDDAADAIKLLKSDPESARATLLSGLLDRHGTGRVMLRNTRSAIQGFPKRVPMLAPLDCDDEEVREELAAEFEADRKALRGRVHAFHDDPRIIWLAEKLRESDDEKFLLICRTQEKVLAIESALRSRINVKVSVFHEGLQLLQRDRNAAWFAEEDGARILLCSEIGSEGRNFQFVHHLVLFDLPLDPELIEQRIGRLDRIGQRHDIQIHAPHVTGTAQAVVARWFAEGVGVFNECLEGGRELMAEFGEKVLELATKAATGKLKSDAALDKLLAATAKKRERIQMELHEGRDRLLEMNSCRPDAAAALVESVREIDRHDQLDQLLLDLFDHFGIRMEDLGERTYQFGADDLVKDAFPSIPPEGLIATSDRSKALSREDVGFLSWDHPIVTGAFDLLLGSEQGNSSFAVMEGEEPALHLEALFILETIAPDQLHVERFLAPTPIRVVVNHRMADASDTTFDPDALKPGSAMWLAEQRELTGELLPRMLEKCEALAEAQSPSIIAVADKQIEVALGGELHRIRSLARVNRNIRSEEIVMLESQIAEIVEHVGNARLRLDSLRLIRTEIS